MGGSQESSLTWWVFWFPATATIMRTKKVPKRVKALNLMKEDSVKRAVAKWLKQKRWKVTDVAMGHKRGVDIRAKRGAIHWSIEAKGCGAHSTARTNYFVSVLGEVLQNMNRRNTKYSLAFPDIPQFKKLWTRLPTLAKRRLKLTALFVSRRRKVVEMK